MKDKAVTIKDIAKLAGVSRGTVDRVLNNRGRVAVQKRDKVIEIAKKLGYQKNIIASNLALNKKRTVNLVIPKSNGEQYWDMVHDGIKSNESKMSRYNVSLSTFDFDLLSKKDYLESLKKAFEGNPTAVLLSPIYLNETNTFLSEFDLNGTAIFTFNSELNHEKVSSFVGQDSYKAGLIAGRLFHLSINKKRKKILCVTLGHEVENASHIKQKIDGLEAFNVQNNSGIELIYLTIDKFYDDKSIKKACKKIEKSHPDFDGIIFTNSRSIEFINNSNYFTDLAEETAVIGFDITSDNIELLKNGKIDYLLNEQPFQQGQESIQNILDHLILKKEIPLKQYLPIDIVISENYELYLDKVERSAKSTT